MTTTTQSVFSQAAAVFPSWLDPESGLRVLCIHRRGLDDKAAAWSTPYHQYPPFLDGGRKVLLHGASGQGRRQGLLDLATGTVEDLFPPDCLVREVNDRTKMATLIFGADRRSRASLWDMRAGQETASVAADDYWAVNNIGLLSDGKRAVVFQCHGKPYKEPVHSRYLLLTPGAPAVEILNAQDCFCSHFMTCPTDPELYSYDRWPSLPRIVEQAIHIRSLDGQFEEPLKLLPDTIRSPDMWGARDHYLWTPDGRWIVSYLFPHALPTQEKFNHLEFEWWLSATDWRTGEDRAAKYPPGRWGGHMGVSPDSRQIICPGGPGFDKLFLVSIAGLKHGWNERILCSYPKTVPAGTNSDPFAYPFALPDQSGVLFNAGWPGEHHGVYLVQWPDDLQ